MTYSVDGKQYVAVAAGGNRGGVTTLDGDAVWAFALERHAGPGRGGPAGADQGRITGRIVALGDPFALPGNDGLDNLTFTGTVIIDDYVLPPSRVQVHAGTTVTGRTLARWSTPLQRRRARGTPVISRPASPDPITFDSAGAYTYNCSPHPWMIGQVIVQ